VRGFRAGNLASVRENVVDQVLGRLEWDERQEGWRGQAEFGGHAVEIACVGEDVHEYERYRPAFLRAWTNVRDLDGDCRQRASSELLDVFNQEWNRDEGGDLAAPLSPSDFMARMKPELVLLHDRGTAEVNYDDRGLFWGHTIFVIIDEVGRVVDAGF
jgi:hypothetical protein